MQATKDVKICTEPSVIQDALQGMKTPELSPNIFECLLHVFNLHPSIAEPRAEWLNLHAGDAYVLMEMVLPALAWRPYVTNVETNRAKHKDYGIDSQNGMGRAKFLPYKAEEYVSNSGYRFELILAILPSDLRFVPVLNGVARNANPGGAVLIYTDYSSDEQPALEAYGYETYTNGCSIVVGYKPQTKTVKEPRVTSYKAREILGLK